MLSKCLISIFLCFELLFSLFCSLGDDGSDVPITTPPSSCKLVTESSELCCTWKYVVDRYCCPEDSYNKSCVDDCTKEERKRDTENALWAIDQYCLGAGRCHWRYNGGGFSPADELVDWDDEDDYIYPPYEGVDLKYIERLVKEGHYAEARGEAKRELNRLHRIGTCTVSEPCDDHLEFILHGSDGELEDAVEFWESRTTVE